jgi:hypothetical protein
VFAFVIASCGCASIQASNGGLGARASATFREIEEQLARYESGEIQPTREEIARLREAIASHRNEMEAEALAQRIERLAGAVGTIPVPAARVGGAVLALVAFGIAALASRKRRPIRGP